ncbi:MAG TPA: hypothetical protein PK997_06315 [Candidatus Omnitrophota bacterium]|jgi:hypothetical protein|nr:hypothetical protein [Candidatus Omnitrophota bacterium]HQB94808.1 hypothetical protein [Candidatus Omnitrophota bacterium]
MDTTSDWEYVMRDFLEVKCSLKEREQEYLLDFLKTKGVSEKPVRIYPAFSVADCLVVVTDGMKTKRRWFYHRGRKKIEE